MKIASIFITIFFTLLFILEADAEQKTIRLICKYSHTINEIDGKSSETSGEDLITVNHSDKGDAIIKKQGLGSEFNGTISDEEIHGKTEYQLSDSMMIQETIVINRYTGAFEMTYKVMGSKGGLIHYGVCEPVSKKKF